MLPFAIALLINLAATWYMVGLIWFVQLVHYAQFCMVGDAQFMPYHHRHTKFTTLAVGPAMLAEAASAVAMASLVPAGVPAWPVWVGVALVAVLWVSTALVQVPQHNVLAGGFDARACGILCRTNWVRTVGWTARGVLVGWVMLTLLVRG